MALIQFLLLISVSRSIAFLSPANRARRNVNYSDCAIGIHFDVADITTQLPYPKRKVTLEAFRVRNKTRDEVPKWVSIGYPILVKDDHGQIFEFDPEYITVKISVLDDLQRQILYQKAKRQYPNENIQEENIITLPLVQFVCKMNFYMNETRYEFQGSVHDLSSSPFELRFPVHEGSNKRAALESRLQSNQRLVLECEMAATGKPETWTPQITVDQLQRSNLAYYRRFDLITTQAVVPEKLTDPIHQRIVNLEQLLQNLSSTMSQVDTKIYNATNEIINNLNSTIEEIQRAIISPQTMNVIQPPPEYEFDRCQLPAASGPCREFRSSWFYDRVTRQCTHFFYGGCDGNRNRFNTKDECENRCLSISLIDYTSSLDPMLDAMDENACNHPLDRGDPQCRNRVDAYHYDKATNQCLPFQYTGCGGNGNRFRTVEECEVKCGGSRETADLLGDVCLLPKDTGPCDNYVAMWFYNSTDGTCSRFYFGGCHGNENRFDNLNDCKRQCADQVDPCTLPAIRGPCNSNQTHFYWDQHSRICKSFSFGGCLGNANNFRTELQCRQRCDSDRSRASLQEH